MKNGPAPRQIQSNLRAVEDRVSEIERLAEADHRQALTRVDELDVDSLAPALRVRVHRAAGNANRALSQLPAAFRHYRRGIEVAITADLAEAEGLIRMSRAGAHSIAGSKRAAIADLERAEEITTGGVRARVKFQRAAVVQRFSEGIEAKRAYDDVIPELRDHGDEIFLAHALSNRGVIHMYHGDQARAVADLTAALDLYEANDLPSPAAVVVHNLGLSYARMLDIPRAMAQFDDGERRLTALDRPLAGLQVDRAEALIASGLVDDALSTIETTVDYLRQRRLLTDLAEALLVMAHACLILGREDSVALADEAAKLFDEQDRPGWRDRAHILRLEAMTAVGTVTEADRRFAAHLSAQLGSAGLRGPAGRAAIIEGSIALALGHHGIAVDALERGGYSRRSGLIEERLAYWALAAAIRLHDGRRVSAMAAARTGLRALEEFRSRVSAPDARVGVAVHAQRLIDVGLLAAAAGRSHRTFFEWTERTAVPYVELSDGRANPDLAPLLGELRQVVRDAIDAPTPDQALRRQRAQLESAIKRRSRRTATSGTDRATRDIDDAIRAAAGRLVVSFVEIDGTIHRCHLTRTGQFGRAVVGEQGAVSRQIRSCLALFRRSALRPDERVVERLARTTEQLGLALFGGLDLAAEDVVIVPRGEVALVPWLALPQTAEAEVTVAFSLGTWHRSIAVPEPRDGPLTIVVGPRLPGAVDEAFRIAATLDDVEVVEPSMATTEAALRALRSSPRVHFACHGDFRIDSPLFSHLEMADGPLTMYDILQLDDAVATEVILSACSGAATSNRPERAFTGMGGAFLTAGIRSIVASVSPVPDGPGTGDLMAAFHRHRSSGRSVRAALRAGIEDVPSDTDRWLARSFMTVGAG